MSKTELPPETREIKALDLEIETPFKPDGVAYFRITKELKEFLNLCEKKHGIAGFVWKVGSFNFGIVLKDPTNSANG